MKLNIKYFVIWMLPLVDVLFSPLVAASSFVLLLVRKAGIKRMKVSKKIFCLLGVYPLRDHYYEPMFNPVHLHRPLAQDRSLPGLDLNERGQLELLSRFDYAEELEKIVKTPAEAGPGEFFYKNLSFPYGDSEYFYSAIRHFKPRKIIEIGSGYSTLMAIKAIEVNKAEDPTYSCQHICIEPYEMEWLESLGVQVIRQCVEKVDSAHFEGLGANDILFIDSSHVIRPQGDVLFEYLELLPILRSGVLVHIHDIFTPQDYPEDWVVGSVLQWNEQYLLEAFLSFNDQFRVLGALSWLTRKHFGAMSRAFPMLRNHPDMLPGSFWIVRN